VARDFASLLPLALTLADYASTAKVSDLPRSGTGEARTLRRRGPSRRGAASARSGFLSPRTGELFRAQEDRFSRTPTRVAAWVAWTGPGVDA